MEENWQLFNSCSLGYIHGAHALQASMKKVKQQLDQPHQLDKSQQLDNTHRFF